MISVPLATALHDAGLSWQPSRGDRFIVPSVGVDEVFVVSDMVVEARAAAAGTILAFNGTTEWALDSVATEDVVWLPSEEQLREQLGPDLVRLEHTDDGYRVVVRVNGAEAGTAVVADACDAYARALLRRLTTTAG